MSENTGEQKPPRKPQKRQLGNGATLYCIASDGKNSLNIFENDNKLTFKTFSYGKPDFDTFTINIKNSKLNIFEKTKRYNSKYIRNVSRNPKKIATAIRGKIKDSLKITGCNFIYEQAPLKGDIGGIPF